MKYNKLNRPRESINKVITKYFDGRMPRSDEIIRKINEISDTKTKTFISLAYLLGGRVSEITRYNIRKYLTKQEAGLKTKILNPLYDEYNNYLPGIKKKDIELMSKNKITKQMIPLNEDEYAELQSNTNINLIMIITARNLKNKSQLIKKAYIPFDLERELVDIILGYIKDLKDDEELFPFNRQQPWKWIQNFAPWFIYNHMLRSFRVVVLQNEYNIKPHKIRKWLGWKDDRNFSNYDGYLIDPDVVDDMLRVKVQ